MADVKISALSAAAALTGAEQVPVVQSGVTVRTTAQDIADLAAGGVTSVNGLTGAVTLSVEGTIIPANNSSCLIYSNASGFADTLPEWGVSANGGFNFIKTLEPDDNNGMTYNNFSFGFEPLQDSPDEVWNINNYFLDMDPTSTGFSFGSNGESVVFCPVTVNAQGTGDLGAFSYFKNNFTVGNGTDPFEWKGMGYAFGFGQINDNITLIGSMQGYGFQWNMSSGAICSPTNTQAIAFYDFCNVACAWDATWTSFQSAPNIAEITTNHNYNAFTSSPTIGLLSGNSGYYGLVISPTMTSYTGTGSFSGININPQTSSVHSAQAIYASMDSVTTYAGTPATLTEQDLTFTVTGVGTGGNAASLEYTSGGTAGSEVVSNTGLAFSVQIQSGVSTATQIKAALDAYPTFFTNVTTTISGVGGNAQTTFGPTSFAGGTDAGNRKIAYLDGDVEITGSLTFGGALSIGKLNAFYSQALVTSGGGAPAGVHSLVSSMTLADNLSVTGADTIGVNTAALIEIGDNSSVATGFLGLASLALPAVVKLGLNSTIDRASGATFAISMDATAGAGSSIGVLDLCRAIAIPNGITSITALRGYTLDLPFGDPGVTTHGVYISPTSAYNYMSRSLVIGTQDTTTNDSCGLELVATDKAVRLSVLTTVQRDALTALKGMIIFNDDTNVLETYDGSAWI
jgi:hypothetical protein